jgi:hypothetical protein
VTCGSKQAKFVNLISFLNPDNGNTAVLYFASSDEAIKNSWTIFDDHVHFPCSFTLL